MLARRDPLNPRLPIPPLPRRHPSIPPTVLTVAFTAKLLAHAFEGRAPAEAVAETAATAIPPPMHAPADPTTQASPNAAQPAAHAAVFQLTHFGFRSQGEA